MIERLRDAAYDVWSGLKSHPGRTLLSFLGIAVGTASLAILLNVTGSLREKADRMQQDFGVNVFCITGKPGSDETPPDIEPKHLHRLRAQLTNALISAITRYSIEALGSTPPYQLIATDQNLTRIRNWTLSAGRFLDRHDLAMRRRVCVLSVSFARETGLVPGDILSIQSLPCRVIGLVKTTAATDIANDSRLGLSDEPTVFIPDTLPPYWIDAYRPPDIFYDTIFIQSADPKTLAQSIAHSRQLLAQPDVLLEHAAWITPELITAEIRQWQRLIEWVAGGIALLCLTMGGMTLMSLMVSNITTRIPEIGLRISLGATRTQVVLLFLSEAAVITLAAALAGTFIAHAILLAGRSRIPLDLNAWNQSAITAITVTLLLSALFAIWPAITASRISPAEALRND
jgi:putative ABC transport system permease protein